MNKNMFYGWRQVCSFSYLQTMKSKAMKITLLILCLLVIFALPVISLVTGSDKEKEKTNISRAYVCSNNDYLIDKVAKSEKMTGDYESVQLETVSENEKDELVKKLKDDDEADYVILQLVYDNNQESMDYGLEAKVIYGENSKITQKDAEGFADYILEHLDEMVLSDSSVDAGILDNLMKEESYEINCVDAEGTISSGNAGLDDVEYTVTYIYLMIVLFAVLIAGSKVAELIVTEKTSRVMEYLLTSIKPLALLLGKVVSSIFMVLTIIAALAASFLVSLILNYMMMGMEGSIWPEFFETLNATGALTGLNVGNLILSILIVLTGFAFYCFIAGLAGGTVGKVEELAEGLKLFSFALLIGAYLVLALMMFSSGGDDMGTFNYVVYYLPLSSVFVVPAYLILGKISLATALISFGILVASTIFVWFFVTKVFETVLYNNGSVMKFKQILAIYKESGKKGSKVKDEK